MSRETRLGLLYGTLAFLIWGLTPIYWKLLQQVPAAQILAHRIVWGLVAVAGWMSLCGRWPDLLAAVKQPRTVAALTLSTVFIAVNWGLFVWAVNADRVLATSLGYYINPLVNVVLGLVVLGEKLNRRQWVAVSLAAAAVSILTIRQGHLPWISLVLAVSFGFYGLLRKTVRADAVVGLTFETMALAPLAVVFLLFEKQRGVAAFGHQGSTVDVLLVVAGAVTVVPLILFTLGVRRIPLSTAGLLQYIAPTCTFLLAVFLYDEPFSIAHAVSFGLIWTALAIYTFDIRQRFRRKSPID
ncbi:MAG: EamA family transporter RarD [Acidobacteriota bacterium]|nr:EamA family transporter RarD [Acidobacteriota bacterium]